MNKLNEILHSATRRMGGEKKAKRIAILAFVAVIVVTLASAASIVSASDNPVEDKFDVDGITYVVTSDEPTNRTVSVKGMNDEGRAGELTISNAVTNTITGIEYKVTAIGNGAFNHCSKLTKVTMSVNMTTIGIGAFNSCSLLADIDLKDVTFIDSGAFNSCSSLESIDLEKVTTIGSAAFHSSGLRSVTLGNNMTIIDHEVFRDCSNLAYVDLKNVTSIGNDAFKGCAFTSVNIPNSVTFIGIAAFKGCGLTSVNIPNSVTFIDGAAFMECLSLTKVTIGTGVKTIGNVTFRGCSNLTDVTMPNSVTKINDWAFWDCTSLTSVNIPNSVTSIDNEVFRNCSNLTSVNIPNSASVGNDAFIGCLKLKEVIVTGTGVVSVNNVISKYFTNDKWGLPGRTEGITTLTLNFASDYAYDVSKITTSIADKTLIFGVNAKATTGGEFYGANGLPITGESRAGLTFSNTADGKWITNSSPDPVDPPKPVPSSTDASNGLYLGFAAIFAVLLVSLIAVLFKLKNN